MADSLLPVFIQTNLGTHFAVAVHHDCMVADLKEEIKVTHACYFPDFGEVSVQAMKVRRKGSFYHLTDSMSVKCSFVGVKGTWFLHLDLLPMTSTKSVQAGANRYILNESGTNPSSQNEKGVNQCFVMNDPFASEGRLASKSPSGHENQTSADIFLGNLTTPGDSSLPDTGNCNITILQSSEQLVSGNTEVDAVVHSVVHRNGLNDTSVLPSSEPHEQSDPASVELEKPVSGGNAVLEQREEQMTDQVKKHEEETNHSVVVVSVSDALAAKKKAKSGKKRSIVQNNLVIEDQLQHSSPEHKKKKKSGILKDEILPSAISSKHIPSQEHCKVSLDIKSIGATTPNEVEVVGNQSKPDSTVPANPCTKRKKRKSDNISSRKDGTVYLSAQNINGQSVEEVPGTKYTDVNRESEPATKVEGVVNANTSNVVSGVLSAVDTEGSLQDTIEKGPSNETSADQLICRGEESEGGKLVGSESVDAVLTTKPYEKKQKLSRKKKTQLLEPSVPETHSSAKDGEDNSKKLLNDTSNGTSAADHELLEKESKAATLCGEALTSTTAGSKLTSKSHSEKPKHTRKSTKKAEIPEQMVPETANPSLKQDDGDNVKEPLQNTSGRLSGGNHGDVEKGSDVATHSGEVFANIISAAVDPAVLNPSGKKLKQSRKKSGKSELIKPVYNEAAPSVKADTKEDLKQPSRDIVSGTSGGECRVKESEGTTNAGELAADLDSAVAVKTALPHAKDTKSKQKSKKPEKKGSLNQELKEASQIVEAKQKETGEGIKKNPSKESKQADASTKVKPLGHTTAADPGVTLAANRKNLGHDNKRTKKNEPVSRLLKDELKNSLEAEHVHVNSEKEVGTINSSMDSESNAGVNPEGTIQNLDYADQSIVRPAGLVNDGSDEHKIAQVVTENASEKHTSDLSGKTYEESGKGTLKKSVELIGANVPTISTKTSGNKTKSKETKKTTSKKRKAFSTPLDSTSDLVSSSVSDEQRKISNASSALVSPSTLLGNRAAKKNQETRLHPQASASIDGNDSHKKTKVSSPRAESKIQTHAAIESIDALLTTNEGLMSKNAEDLMRSGHVEGSLAQKRTSSDVCADAHVLPKGSLDNISASSESTERPSQVQRKYRVAVRKIPSKRYRKEMGKSSQKEISLGTPATIFDGTSDSSEDEFELNQRRTPFKSLDYSSNSSDSDEDLGGTQVSSYKDRAYMDSPEGVSTCDDGIGKEEDGERTARLSNEKKKARPLNMIFKGTNIFQNAFRSSQSEFEESEAQPDCVLETQPE